MLEQEVSGGQAGTSPLIRNYPGFPHGVEGGLLMERTCEQAWLMGAKIVFAQSVVGLERRGGPARRAARRRQPPAGPHGDRRDGHALAAPGGAASGGADRLGRLLRGGGGRDTGDAGPGRVRRGCRQFSRPGLPAPRPPRPHGHPRGPRREPRERTMSQYLIDGLRAADNVEVRLRTEVVDGAGVEALESLTLCDRASGHTHEVNAGGLFIMIGGEPYAQWLPPGVARDEKGYVVTGAELSRVPERRLAGAARTADARDEPAGRVRSRRCAARSHGPRRLGGRRRRDRRAARTRAPPTPRRRRAAKAQADSPGNRARPAAGTQRRQAASAAERPSGTMRLR